MTNNTIKAILGYTFIVFNSIIILIVFKVLYNIIATVKQFIVMELTI